MASNTGDRPTHTVNSAKQTIKERIALLGFKFPHGKAPTNHIEKLRQMFEAFGEDLLKFMEEEVKEYNFGKFISAIDSLQTSKDLVANAFILPMVAADLASKKAAEKVAKSFNNSDSAMRD